ncbi:SDR family NAD(P)-dependent oxidoreductase [Pedobacter mucosus]|uniref:SDR family NAD(P)-dependent oxidoreductase n=1 Tax=Pedobacter mucosus TaxID=2895286 RepID=UPI001EE44308|nr:SDR family oxidoreductase [Pedobacter mucosus]UKT64897.1 SDR family oxidoreductase [Pedobacter mucosus]
MKSYKEKIALVTGALEGIGYEIAKLFAKDGINLILVARNKERLQKIKEEFEKQYAIVVYDVDMDLSISGKAAELFALCTKENLRVDYLVNNAGYGDFKKLSEGTPKTYENMLNLNVIALTDLTTRFVKNMTNNGYGKILNVGSLAAFQSTPLMAVYAASKSYVMHFTEALHAELRETGVTATVLNPGVTKTGFVDRANMDPSAFAQGVQLDAAKVAKAGYKGMMAGKLNVVPGLLNSMLAFGTSITPSRRLLLAISAYVMREKNN